MAATKCVHHWRLDEPDGVSSHGRCLTCGAGREFANTLVWKDDYLFGSEAKAVVGGWEGVLQLTRTG